MWRFLLPAVFMVGAPLVLLAGALGELPSWADLSAMLVAAPAKPTAVAAPTNEGSPAAVDTHPVPAPAVLAPAPTAQSPAPEMLQQQLADLQAQIGQRTHELASLRANEEQERAGLDTLRRQRQAEEESVARQQAQQRKTASAAPAAPKAQARPQHPPPAARVMASQSAPAVSPLARLVTARQALLSGQPGEARRLLSAAEIQLVFQPVVPGQPAADAISAPAARIGYAIRLLDAGDTGQALQMINIVIDGPEGQGAGARQNG
jgi:hypothetical protein